MTEQLSAVEAKASDIGREGNEILKDPFGREICLIEGIVLKTRMPDVVVTYEDIEEAHKQLVNDYITFWDYTTPTPAIPSELFKLNADSDSKQLLLFQKLNPLVLGSNPVVTVEKKSAKSWQCQFTINVSSGVSRSCPQTLKVDSIALSPNGTTVASGHSGQTVILWDLLRNGEIKANHGHLLCPSSSLVTFSPDGRFVASSYHFFNNFISIKIWDSETGENHQILNGHASKVTSVAFSSDSQTLASGDKGGDIRLWNPETGQELAQSPLFGHSCLVSSVAASSDSQTLASGDRQGVLILWKLTNGEKLRTISAPSHPINSVAFSPDGRILASGSNDKTIKLWDVETGQVLRTFSGHTGQVTSVAFNSDGKTLASGGVDARIRLWNVNTGKEVDTLTGHKKRVNSVAFSVDGQTLASGGKDGTIRIWQLR